MSRYAALLHGLHAAHFEMYAHAVLDHTAAPERGVHPIAQDVAFLFGAGEADTAKLLLAKALHGRSNADLTNMISALRQQNQPEPLAAADWVTKKYAQLGSSNIDSILRQIGPDEYTRRSRNTWLKRRRKSD